MLMALDDTNILRLVNTSPQVVDVVKTTIDAYWIFGLEAEGRISSGKSPKTSPKKAAAMEEPLSWEFVLKGSPWRASAAKIGRSRQFITYLLDALSAYGWTVVTGLDISRAQDKKSALLFQRCPPVRGLHHVCLSPLGKQRIQLINAPGSLRHLVRREFANMVIHEKLSDDDTVYELIFDHRRSSWTADPEQDKDTYIYTRKRMGRLLDALMDGNWRVIASADVARQTRESDSSEDGEGIHSWFLMFCGSFIDTAGENPVKVTANSALQVGGRIGSARPEALIYLGPPTGRYGHRGSIPEEFFGAISCSQSLRDRRRGGSVYHRKQASPSPDEAAGKVTKGRKSRSGYDI